MRKINSFLPTYPNFDLDISGNTTIYILDFVTVTFSFLYQYLAQWEWVWLLIIQYSNKGWTIPRSAKVTVLKFVLLLFTWNTFHIHMFLGVPNWYYVFQYQSEHFLTHYQEILCSINMNPPPFLLMWFEIKLPMNIHFPLRNIHKLNLD